MNKEKRGTTSPVPDSLRSLLTQEQAISLMRWENFGWRVAFVRRPLFQDIVVVLTSSDGEKTGILEADGELSMELNIKTRE